MLFGLLWCWLILACPSQNAPAQCMSLEMFCRKGCFYAHHCYPKLSRVYHFWQVWNKGTTFCLCARTVALAVHRTNDETKLPLGSLAWLTSQSKQHEASGGKKKKVCWKNTAMPNKAAHPSSFFFFFFPCDCAGSMLQTCGQFFATTCPCYWRTVFKRLCLELFENTNHGWERGR